MRALLLTCLFLTAAAAVPSVSAMSGPPAGSCNAVTNPCWNDSLVCTWYSLQIPFCVANPLHGLTADSAGGPEMGPLLGTCSALTKPCWNGDVFCFWISLQVPQCVPLQVQ